MIDRSKRGYIETDRKGNIIKIGGRGKARDFKRPRVLCADCGSESLLATPLAGKLLVRCQDCGAVHSRERLSIS